MTRVAILMNTMKTVQGWDLEEFLSIDPNERDAIMEAMRDDVNKLIAEMKPGDPMAQKLRDELQATMDHYYKLLQMSQKEPGAFCTSEASRNTHFVPFRARLLRAIRRAHRRTAGEVGGGVETSQRARRCAMRPRHANALQGYSRA